MPIQKARDGGLWVPLGEYKKLKAFQQGGYYWDPAPQALIREHLGDFLAPVEISHSNGIQGGWFRRFSGGRELLHASRPLGPRPIPPAELSRLEACLERMALACASPEIQPHNRALLERFRLPDPETELGLYRLRGPLWRRRLEVLWGCEKAEDNSLAPSEALARLSPDRLYGLKAALGLAGSLLMIVGILWLLALGAGAGVRGCKRAINKPPQAAAEVVAQDQAGRVLILDLSGSYDPDGYELRHRVDWGDGTTTVLPVGEVRPQKQYDRDGSFRVRITAIDALGAESIPREHLVVFSGEAREADRLRIADEGRLRLEAAAGPRSDTETVETVVEEGLSAAASRIAEGTEAARSILAVPELAVPDPIELDVLSRSASSSGVTKSEPPAQTEVIAGEDLLSVPEAVPEMSVAEPDVAEGFSDRSVAGGASAALPSLEFQEVSSGRPVRVVRFTKPPYPRRALSLGIQGSIDLRFTVGADGTPKDIRIETEKNGGFFREAVIEAVKNARFEPAVIDGLPVDQDVIYRIVFVLD